LRGSVREGPPPVASGADPATALVGVGRALTRLGQAASLPALFAEAARALCEEAGFARAAVFSFRDHALELQSVHAFDEQGYADRVRRRLGEEPVRLGPWLYESEVLRRRTPLLVGNAALDTHALATLPGTTSYVLAPVTSQGEAVALVHADHGPAGRAATPSDRAALWAFSVGFGHALQRTALEERVRRHSERVVALARSAEANAEQLLGAGIEGLPAPLGRLAPTGASNTSACERLAMLTPREQEVLAMLAEGETNARIAQRLVVSEDTVKTHVKHILRKLGVRNRSQAVSRYFRTRAMSALETPRAVSDSGASGC
jgi:LuxR family transcriptional regulator, regulator of acetate metabolism